MNNSQTVVRVLLGALVFAVPVAASAQDRGFYAGVDMGVASLPGEANLQVNDIFLKDTDSDEDALVLGFTAGYRFSRYFAVEAGWIDLGENTISLADASGADAARGVVRYRAEGATAAVIGMLPFGRKWEATLKLGMLFPNYHLDIDGDVRDTPFATGFSTDETRAFGGLSVRYHVSERWHVKLAIDHYEDVGDRVSNGGGQLNSLADITTVTVGVVFRF